MKNILLTLVLSIIVGIGFSQSWMPNADSIPNCELIKSGKFLNMKSKEAPMQGYAIVFEDGYATEIINDGQYYLKSKIVFASDCSYTSTVIEVTIPNYAMGVGTIIYTEIMATNSSLGLLEIKSTYKGEEYVFVLKKVSE